LLLSSLVATSLISVAALIVAIVLLAMNYRRLPARIPKLLDVDAVLVIPASARASLQMLAAADDPQMSWRRGWLLYLTATFALETLVVAHLSWTALRSGTIIIAEVSLIASALNAVACVVLVVYVWFQVRSAAARGSTHRGALVPKTFARLSPIALALGLVCVGAYGVWVYVQLHTAQF
jgi:hypothetical protein